MRWLKTVSVLLLSASFLEATGHECSIDKPGVSKLRSYEMVYRRMEPCFWMVASEFMVAGMKDPKTQEGIRSFFNKFCSRHREVTSCMAHVRSSLSPCHNRNVSVPFMILSHMAEHLLTVGCEDNGEQLAVIVHGYLSLRHSKEDRNCFYKTASVLTLADDADVDLTSGSYMTFKEIPMLKRCLKNVRDEAFKAALDRWIDEITSSLRCLDPKEDVLIPCASLDVSLVNVSNVCELKPASLYDQLEGEAIDCFSFVHSHELREGTNYGDLDWLTEDYKRMCQIHRVSLDCLLEKAGFAEACLSPAEDKQFQLFMDSLNDVIQMGCLEDGRRVAKIMHEVYRLKSNITDCFKSIVAKRGDATANKNLRFYRDMTSFKSCVVGELKDSGPTAREAEEIIENILSEMKCVSPEDGNTVVCETLHTHWR